MLDIIDSKKFLLDEKRAYDIDIWKVIPFYVQHDVPNYNYLIKNTVTGSVIAYITDTGYIDNIQISDVDYFIIECNHETEHLENLVRSFPEAKVQYERVLSHKGHLGDTKCLDFLSTRANLNTKKVILCHISKSNYEENKFKKLVDNMFKQMGFNIKVYELNPNSTSVFSSIPLQEKLYDFDSEVE